MLLVYVGMGATMLTISAFWKISLHAGGVGGFAAALTRLFGPAWALAFLAVPLVGWAQVAAGGLVGAVVTTAVLAVALR